MGNFVNEANVLELGEIFSDGQNRILTDASALQTADQVLSNIERVQLKVIVNNFDLKKIREILVEYKAIQNEASERALQVEFRAVQEIELWRQSLARRDEAVKAFHLRRFYDQNAAAATPPMLAALGCFYRGLTPSFEVRSKYDFVATQLFSSKLPGKPRFVRLGSENLIEQLTKLNAVWTGVGIDWADKYAKNRREDAVAVFDSLRREAETFNKLEDLLKSGFFKNLRRHKQYLGETFFAPEVTAASIQCNVAVGNKFSQLVSSENENFRRSLEFIHGGVDALNLVLEENPTESIVLLNQINTNYLRSVKVDEVDSNTEFAAANGKSRNSGGRTGTIPVEASDVLDESSTFKTFSENEMSADCSSDFKSSPQNTLLSGIENKSSVNIPNEVAKRQPIETKASESRKVNRGLIAAAILAVLAGYHFFSPANEVDETQAAQASGIIDVDVKTLNGGEQLVVARISNNALIAVVNHGWKNIAVEKKRENLQSLLKQGSELQFKSILLFDSRGEIVGNANAQEITAK